MPDDTTAQRRNLLTTALVGALLPKDVPGGHMVRAWLDSWSGVGHVAEEMHEVGYNVRLMRTLFGWRADFCRDEHTRLIRWLADASDATPGGGAILMKKPTAAARDPELPFPSRKPPTRVTPQGRFSPETIAR